MNTQEKIESATAEVFPKIHFTTTHYELNQYKKQINWLFNEYSALTQLSFDDLIRNKIVLEVGCGGRASGINALNSFYPKSISAIDLSDKNVQNTSVICRKLGFVNVQIEQGNVLELAFRDNQFDFVFSNGVIHHTVNPYRCFQEMHRVLKPGGYLLLGIYGYGGVWGKAIHPFGRWLGKLIPIKIMERLVNCTGIFRSQENSLLDWFYTPIQQCYPKKVIHRWFWENNFERIIDLGSPKWFYNMGILTNVLFGDGYIYMMGQKKLMV